MTIHVVKKGETLWGISQKYDADLNEIIKKNEIPNPNILVSGQAIFIPYRFIYAVKPGDNLWMIAEKFDVTVQDLASANGISNTVLINAGVKLKIPQKQRPVLEMNAYTTRRDEEGEQEVVSLSNYLTYLTPFTYAIKEDGTINDIKDTDLIASASKSNVTPLMVLTNYSGGKFDSELVAKILRNTDLQKILLDNILIKMKAKGYKGLNIDFEYVKPEDRKNYNEFLRRTVERIHSEGFSVSTALAPKLKSDQAGLLYEAHDYKSHGEIVDFVVLMTYEWGWAGGKPMAIAPLSEVKKVLDYAVTVIPRNKILMGMPLYGRDWKLPWVKGTFAKTVSPQQAIALAAKYGVSIQYDGPSQAPYFRYFDETGQQHEVWFEDARSMKAKFDTIKQYKLRGGSYWVLGNPFPQNWLVQEEELKVRKY